MGKLVQPHQNVLNPLTEQLKICDFFNKILNLIAQYIGPMSFQIIKQKLVQCSETHMEAQSCKAFYREKNPAYQRHRICQRVRIIEPTQKETPKNSCVQSWITSVQYFSNFDHGMWRLYPKSIWRLYKTSM